MDFTLSDCCKQITVVEEIEPTPSRITATYDIDWLRDVQIPAIERDLAAMQAELDRVNAIVAAADAMMAAKTLDKIETITVEDDIIIP